MKRLMAHGLSTLHEQRGVTVIIVAILLVVFVGIAAMAVDLSHLYVVRNELQNAADAGALASARFLYNDMGTSVNPGANQIAYDAATANKAMAKTAGAIAVDVNWTAGQNMGPDVDVQRGHWRFADRSFTANDSLLPVDLWNVTTEELDNNMNFINAVRVVARRQASPAASFFARVFGNDDFELSAEAVAYIGFAGSLRPEDVDQPIAICRWSIQDPVNGTYDCSTGRMINSSGGTTTNTGAWTNFSQDPCQTASVPTVRPLVCGSGNMEYLDFGSAMGTVGGMQNTVYDRLLDCWKSAFDGTPNEFWPLRLPVIDCPDNNPGPCSVLLGVVTLEVLWIKQSGTDPHWQDIPLEMAGWSCSLGTDIDALNDADRQACWQEFASEFNLHTADGTSVGDLSPSDLQKTMFFRPSCDYHEPAGITGGQNFGVLARIPVLVR